MAEAAPMTIGATLHEDDLFLWTREQAGLLREGRFDELDLGNLIVEVESVAAAEKREIRNRLSVLLAHLLKWKYQPGGRRPSWRNTIYEQRKELLDVIEDSPSLRQYPGDVFATSYRSARLRAAQETGIDFTLFAETPPFTVEQALENTFLPEEPDLYDRS